MMIESFTFAKRSDVDDGYGNKKSGFVDQFTARCSVRFLRGGEGILAARLSGKQPVIIKVRRFTQSTSVTTDWRATDTHTGTIYNIRSVMPEMDRRHIEFLAESGAG